MYLRLKRACAIFLSVLIASYSVCISVYAEENSTISTEQGTNDETYSEEDSKSLTEQGVMVESLATEDEIESVNNGETEFLETETLPEETEITGTTIAETAESISGESELEELETEEETEADGVNTNSFTISEEEVISKLNGLIASYEGTYWTTDGQPSDEEGVTSKKHKGIQSKGFANFVFNELFGVWNIGEASPEGMSILNPDGAEEVGCIEGISQESFEDVKTMFTEGKPGDYIQASIRESSNGHSMILVSVNEDGIVVFDCNSDGQCGISKRSMTWDVFCGTYSGVALYRARNYSIIQEQKQENKETDETEELLENEKEKVDIYEAFSQSHVTNRLSELIAQYVGKTGTWSFAGGSQCYGFAHMIFNDIFNRGTKQVGNGAVSSNATCYKLNNISGDIITIGTLNPGYSDAQLETLLEKVVPGDYIQVRRSYSPYNPHSMIAVNVDKASNTIDIFDANSDGKGTVKHYTQTFSTFKSKNQGVSVYRYYDYSPNPPSSPSNVTLSKNQAWYDIKDTVVLTPSCSGGVDYYWISVMKGEKYVYNGKITGALSLSAGTLGYGDFTAWITATNSAGSADSKAITFSVCKEPGYTDVWASSTVYDLDDTVSISVSTLCAKGQVIGIDRGSTRVYTGDTGSPYTVSARTLGVGTYSAYFSIYNGSGTTDTKRVTFVITDRANLGDEFFAKIKNPSTGKYLANMSGNVQGEDNDCDRSRIWLFKRLDDGSYKIINSKDYYALDIREYGNGGNGTNVQVNVNWDTTAQRFYIQKAYGAYYLKPLCCDMFVDMAQQSPYNVEAWGGGVNWDPQKFEIIKVNSDYVGVHSYTSKITKAATCTTTGVRTYTCSRCEKSYTESIAKTAHKYSTSWTTDKAATCIAEGSKSHHCTVCGAKKDITSIPKISHSYTSKVTKAASCTATGVRTYTCSVCKNSYTESIAKTAHKYSTSWTTDKAATCIAEGSKSHHCTVCGAKKDITSIPKISHSYTSKVTKAASCTATGVRTYTCSVCKNSYTESIAKTAHQYSTNWTTDKAATCIAEGSKSHHCTVCGAKKDITAIPKIAHSYDAGVVTVKPTEEKEGIKTYTCTLCHGTKTEKIPKLSSKPVKPEELDQVEAFVSRLYKEILGRDADPSGLKAWADVLKSGKEQGAKVAQGFIGSEELKKRNLPDDAYIRALYRTFFDREADDGGLAAWQKVLDSGLSRMHVFRGFAESDEFTKICDSYGIIRGYADLTAPMDQNEGVTKFIVRSYRLCLNREADAGGLNGWCDAILSGKNTAKEAAYGFVFSNEFIKKNLSDREYIKVLYRVFMDREADGGGLSSWEKVLKEGKSREHVFNGFADSAEFLKICQSYGIK